MHFYYYIVFLYFPLFWNEDMLIMIYYYLFLRYSSSTILTQKKKIEQQTKISSLKATILPFIYYFLTCLLFLEAMFLLIRFHVLLGVLSFDKIYCFCMSNKSFNYIWEFWLISNVYICLQILQYTNTYSVSSLCIGHPCTVL